MKRRFISLLLVLVLLVGIAPVASAAGPELFLDFNVFEENTFLPIPNAQIFGYIGGVRAFRLLTDPWGQAFLDIALPAITSELVISIVPPSAYRVVRTEAYNFTQGEYFDLSASPDGTFSLYGPKFAPYTHLDMWWAVTQSSAQQPPPAPFTDVPPAAWFH